MSIDDGTSKIDE